MSDLNLKLRFIRQRLTLFIADIVFFIFLYQRWIYKVDSKRVNEFGFSAEMLDEKAMLAASQTGAQAAIADAAPVAKPIAEKKKD